MRVEIDNVGRVGMMKDQISSDTPPEAWTALRNMRMGAYGAEVFLGHERSLNTNAASWTQNPIWLQYVPLPGGTGYWLGLGTTKVYARQAGGSFTETDISRAVGGAYNATADRKWQGGVFGGLAIVNNSVDEPQAWPVVSGATALVNLSTIGAAPWPNNYRCRVMRPFGRFLVAADITKVATRYPQLVKWCHPADPGAFPTRWDPTDPAYDAGEFPLADAEGPIVDMQVLRNYNVLYTTDQVWLMKYVGGQDIMGFEPMFHEQGALATGCVAGFKKDTEYHCVLGGDDLFIHNGQSPRSIVSPAMRRWFFSLIDPVNYQRSFVVTNPVYSEVWVCIPENGMSQPTLALVWNWDTGSIGFRDLLTSTSNGDVRNSSATFGTTCIAQGYLEDSALEPWSGDTAAWSSDTTAWASRSSSPVIQRLLMTDQSAGKRTFVVDSSYTYDLLPISMLLERSGLSILRQDRGGEPKIDLTTDKLVTEIWPRLEASEGVNVFIGTQDTVDAPVTWSDAYAYTPGVDEFAQAFASGRIISVRFTGSLASKWRMSGYALEIAKVGTYN